MKFIADLHIHSKYSRATSKDMTLEELDRWADNKGILVMATGDFTHPAWFAEIKEKLEPAEPGLFKLKKEFKKPTLRDTLAETRFILSVEISSIYSRDGKVHRIHNIIFSPDIETAEKINTQLSWIGNIKSDGRPILGLDARELAKIVFNINPQAVIIPAHIWTPWFSMFGSMSGFNSIEECFGEYAKNIFAIETGISSDPVANWRLSKLDKIAFISNSDSHSLQRIGREANIFDAELSYDGIMDALKTNDSKKFVATIEFFPEEGRYHFDGHRDCGIVFSPKETKKHKGICPKCEKKLTIGVMSRVDELADRPEIKINIKDFPHKYENRVPYYSLVALDEIISEAYNVGVASKKIKKEYEEMIKKFGNESKILLEVSEKEMDGLVDNKIIEGIRRVRNGQLKIRPGYDGEYGVVKIFDEGEREKL